MSRSYRKPYYLVVGMKESSIRSSKRRANRRFRRVMRFSKEKLDHKKFIDLAWNEDLVKKRSIDEKFIRK